MQTYLSLASGRCTSMSWSNAPSSHCSTPEHRWFRRQLAEIRSRIASMVLAERDRQKNPRRRSARSERALEELRSFESRISSLLELEPLAEAVGEPPANFSSLLLQAAPGYREAYSTCLVLRMGLRLEGGPLQLSLKEISTLYEYWCYLAVIKLAAEQLGAQLDASDFLKVPCPRYPGRS